MIKSLQVFRGLAACAVVGHHAVLSTQAFVENPPTWIQKTIGMGHLGVDFFFVLSGFIIMHSHMQDECSLIHAKRYFFKRITRIFPPYLPIGLFMIVLYSIFPSFSANSSREYSFISSIFLFPSNYPPALSVAWTLIHEMVFYTIFLIFFISKKFFLNLLLLWTLIIIITNAIFVPSGWEKYLLSLRNIEFVFGVVSAILFHKTINLPIKNSFLISIGIIITITSLTVIIQKNDSEFYHLIFSLGIAIIILGTSFLEGNKKLNWPKIFVLLGNASYSIYLIHNPLLSLTQRVFGKFFLGWAFSLILGIFISILFGIIYHIMLEKPSLHFFRKSSISLKTTEND